MQGNQFLSKITRILAPTAEFDARKANKGKRTGEGNVKNMGQHSRALFLSVGEPPLAAFCRAPAGHSGRGLSD
jgi:hypothetical protein